MEAKKQVWNLGSVLFTGVFVLGTFMIAIGVLAQSNITSQVVVGNANPSVSAVTVNGGSAITLNPNATTSISVNATVADNNGCTDINNGTTTVLLYRSGVTSSTCQSTQSNSNCYKLTAFTASSTCSTTSKNTTSTFGIYYFANATDASSSYPTQNWMATVVFTDPSGGSGNADSGGVELNTLTAINVTTSSVNYGTLAAGSDTGGTNQSATTANVGNSTTTLQVRASQTLTSGSNTIATSSQHYATSTFTFGGAEQQLSGTLATVSGFLLTAPTSTSDVSSPTFWGLIIPGGTATGTYSGTNVFSSLFQP